MASPIAFAASLTDVQGRPTPRTSTVSQGPTGGAGVTADGAPVGGRNNHN